MKHLLFLSFIMWALPGNPILFAQGLLNDAANFVITPDTYVKVSGGVDNQNGHVSNAGVIQLTEDYTQSGPIANYDGNGWLNFQGTLDQLVSGIDSISKLKVNNGNKLLISNDLRITDSLDLSTNGNVQLGTNDLLLTNGVDLINFDANNYIITNNSGSLKRSVDVADGVVDFPVGRSSYNMASLENTGATDTFSVRVDDVVLSEGSSGVAETQDIVNRTWFINEETTGGSNVDMTVQWNTAEQLTGFSPLDCGISHYDGTDWDVHTTSAATVVSGSTYSQSRSGQSSFSPFAVEGASLPLSNCAPNEWTGTNSNSWSDPLNWSCGVVPTNNCLTPLGSDTAVIPTGTTVIPVVTGTVGAVSLDIETGASITINGILQVCGDVNHNGNDLTGTGDLELVGTAVQNLSGNGAFGRLVLNNNTGASVLAAATLSANEALVLTAGTFTNNGSFTLNASASSTAYLDDFTSGGVTYTGNITSQQFVTPGSGVGQRMFGSPVVNGVVNGLSQTYASGSTGQIVMSTCGGNVDVGSPYNNLFEWHEDASSPNACSFEAWFARTQSTPLDNARGYSGWMQDGTVFSFTAAPNTGNVSYGGSLGNLGSGLINKDGWHVLSNPYPSPVNANTLTLANWSSLQTYDPGQAYAGTFQPILPGQDLAIAQGFVAFTNVNSNSANFTNAMRIADTVSFKSNNDWFISKLDIEVVGNGFKDVSYLYYNDEATLGFDNQWDCVKKPSDSGQPTLFTRIAGEKSSLNGQLIDELGDNPVPLGLAPGANGQFVFTVTGLNTLPSSVIVYLEDKATGIWTNLRDTSSYSFGMSETENEDRFELHFTKPIIFTYEAESCEGNDGTISVDFGNQSIGNQLQIWNYELRINNSVIASGSEANLTELQDLEPGDYEMTFTNGNLQVTEWITIEDKVQVEALFNLPTVAVFVGDEVFMSNNSTGASSYTWEVNNEVFNTQDLTYSFIAPGIYVVRLNSSNADCSDWYEESLIVKEKTTISTGIATQIALENIVVYVQDNNLVVDLSKVDLEGQTDLEVFNALGQLIVQKLNIQTIENIEMANEARGYYFVNIINQQEQISKKVIIK